MKFTVKGSSVAQQNGEYEVEPNGGYRHLPDWDIQKPNVAHLVEWLTRDGNPGTVVFPDGHALPLLPENYEALLADLGFRHLIGVRWGTHLD